MEDQKSRRSRVWNCSQGERMESAVRRYGIKTEGEVIRPAVDAIRGRAAMPSGALRAPIPCQALRSWIKNNGFLRSRCFFGAGGGGTSRCDLRKRRVDFAFYSAPRSVATRTTIQVVIHDRSHSTPNTTIAKKANSPEKGNLLFGAGGGGRTRTVSLPPDFESGTSANSITPAWGFDLHSISHTKEKIKIREKKSFCRLLPCKAHLYCPLLLTFSRVYYIIME